LKWPSKRSGRKLCRRSCASMRGMQAHMTLRARRALCASGARPHRRCPGHLVITAVMDHKPLEGAWSSASSPAPSHSTRKPMRPRRFSGAGRRGTCCAPSSTPRSSSRPTRCRWSDGPSSPRPYRRRCKPIRWPHCWQPSTKTRRARVAAAQNRLYRLLTEGRET